jgi:hypothetical protein
VAEIVQRLQVVLRGNPAPWLRKAMGLTIPEPSPSLDQTA